MGRMKEWAAERRDAPAPFSVSKGTALTWADIEMLTGGLIGTFALPCPYCAPWKFSSTRFRLARPTLGRATWRCFYCGESGELSTDIVDPVAQAKADALRAEQNEEKTAAAIAIWNDGVSIARTPAIDYLTARGIRDLPPNVNEVLRYHPSCSFGLTRRRAMLGLFRDLRSDEPKAIQRTAITPDGRNVERWTMGPKSRAAIKLWPREGKTLVIGEGIETTLAAAFYLTRADGRPLRPAWALTTADQIKFFPILNWVRRLIILVDNDDAGQTAAKICAQRWSRLGREVVLLRPNRVNDFNDLIKG